MKHQRVAKILGEDAEYCNSVLGVAPATSLGSGERASRLLLHEIAGVPAESQRVQSHYQANGNGIGTTGTTVDYDPQDFGRKYSRITGGCAYIDLAHVEMCIPEVTSARDFVAATRVTQATVADAQRTANERLPPGQRILALANNSDGLGHSYGSHLNVMVSRKAYDDIFERVFPALLLIAAFNASSQVLSGQGKVGAENGLPPVDYQISQRADFFETLVGMQTTYRRPLVNSRDETLCGSRASGLARLHCISFDHNLCDVSRFLKAGTLQILLAMIEAGWSNLDTLLEHPVQAFRHWSRDPSLRATARLLDGRRVTAVEHQQLFCERAGRFVEQGECEGFVPEAELIMRTWEETLMQLQGRDWSALARRLDWVLKRTLIERTLDARPELDWRAPQVKHLDLMYASVDEAGLYQVARQAGFVEHIASDEHIERFRHQPPDDTRAYTRAMLLRRFGAEVASMDWDYLQFHRGRAVLDDPRSCTRAEMQNLIASEPLHVVLRALGTPAASVN